MYAQKRCVVSTLINMGEASYEECSCTLTAGFLTILVINQQENILNTLD